VIGLRESVRQDLEGQWSRLQQGQQAGLVRTAATAQQSVLNGILDPLSGVPRDRPYWDSMYGNLGKSSGPYYPRGGK